MRCLWMTRPPAAVCRPRSGSAPWCPKRHARRAVTRNAAQAPDLRRGRAPSRPSWPPACGCAPARALRSRPQFVSAASHGAAPTCARRARRRCSAPRAGACAPRMSVPGRSRALLIGAGARLPLAAEPLARQRLPLRADLLGLRARGARAPRRGGRQLPDARAGSRAATLVRRRASIRCPRAAAAVHAAARLRRAPTAPPPSLRHRRLMTDIRRTLLWVIFSLSLFLLWDAVEQAQRPAVVLRPAAGAASPPPAPRRRRRRLPAAPAGAGGAGGAAAGAPRRRRRRRAGRRAGRRRAGHGHDRPRQGDARQPGGDARPGRAAASRSIPSRSAAEARRAARPARRSRLYVAADRPGAAGRRPGLPEPPHADDARARRAHAAAGPERAGGAFESPPVGGVKLVKTYTFQRGDYVDRRQARGRQRLGARRSTRAVPAAGARRQRAAGRARASTSPSPARRSTPTARKFQKIDFKRHREARRRQARPRDQRRQRLGRDGAALLRLGLAGRQARRAAPPREFFTGKVDTNTYSVGMLAAARRDRARRDARRSTRASSSARRKRTSSRRSRPGLELVKDYGWFTILAKPLFWLLTQLHKLHRQLGLVDRRRWWCC